MRGDLFEEAKQGGRDCRPVFGARPTLVFEPAANIAVDRGRPVDPSAALAVRLRVGPGQQAFQDEVGDVSAFGGALAHRGEVLPADGAGGGIRGDVRPTSRRGEVVVREVAKPRVELRAFLGGKRRKHGCDGNRWSRAGGKLREHGGNRSSAVGRTTNEDENEAENETDVAPALVWLMQGETETGRGEWRAGLSGANRHSTIRRLVRGGAGGLGGGWGAA